MQSQSVTLVIESRSRLSPDAAFRAALSPAELVRASFPLLGLTFEGGMPPRWEAERVYRVRIRQFACLPARSFEIKFREIDGAKRTFLTEEWGGEFESWRHRLTVQTAPGGCLITDRIDIKAKSLPPGAVPFIRLLYRFRRWRLR